MQKAYIRALYELMQKDSRVMLLLSDSATDYDVMLAGEFPGRCYNFGISEQNKVGIAAGMALCGKIPFVNTTGAFLAYRSYEFIRNDVCYQNQNVKIVGVGSGTSMRTMGPSHHSTEDLAALRALPNLTILSPSTPAEAAECVKAAYEHEGPVYLRLGMFGENEYYPDGASVSIGGCNKLCDGNSTAVFVTGSILSEVMEARRLLQEEGISPEIYDIYSVKPINREAVTEAAKKFKTIFSVEEHSISGGLGGAIAEILAENGSGAKLVRIGLDNSFVKGYGTQEEVRETNGLDSVSIAGVICGKLKDE